MSAQVARFPSFEGGHETTALPGDSPKKHHICSKFLKKRPPDIYGQKHAIETPALIQDSLELLESELWKLSDEKLSGMRNASMRCPDIFESKEHRIMFLRCEQFNVDVRIFRYEYEMIWIMRIFSLKV